jgi:hypothetical protein
MKLKASEIKSLKGLLRNARELIDDAENAAHAVGDTALARRVRNISKRVDDELHDLERKLAAAERIEEGSSK